MASRYPAKLEFSRRSRRTRAFGTRAALLGATLALLTHCGGSETPDEGAGGSGASGATAGVVGTSAQGGTSFGGSAGQASGAGGTAGSVSQGGTSGSTGASGGASGSSAGGTAGASGASGAAGSAGGGAAGAAGAAGAGAGGSAGAAAGGTSGSSGSAGASGAGAGSAGTSGTAGTGGTAFTPDFILGADISSVQEAYDSGTRYADTDGTQKDILDILKAHGFNYIRLRAFVEPNAPYGYAAGSTGGGCAKAEAYCDTAHTVEFAQQIKAKGMGFLLDLHYSDTWADPGKQIIPRAFRDATTIDELANRVRTYTTEIVTALVGAGARPDMVQVGNEITPGMLIHVPDDDTDCWGNQSAQASLTGSTSNWENLGTLLGAGIEGVKAVDQSIEIMLHIENTDELDGVRWWLDNALEHVEFDVLGLSAYVAYQGQPSVWRNTFESLAEEYPELTFAIAEYNPERTEANHIMRDLPDGRGRGTFFWEPTQSGAWGQSLFTASENVMRANTQDFAEFDTLKEELGL